MAESFKQMLERHKQQGWERDLAAFKRVVSYMKQRYPTQLKIFRDILEEVYGE